MTVKMTQAGSEAPTVEQPALRPLDEPTIREKVEGAMRRKLSSDQTAELALDDLGLELGSLEQTDSQIGLKPVGGMPRGPDANAPTMVAGLDENSQRLLAAAAARHGGSNADDSQLTEHGASGTWFLTERELGGDVDLTKGRSIDPNSTASMSKLQIPEEGFDISSTSRLAAIDRNNLDFPVEPTAHQPAMRSKVDLDLGAMASICREARPKSWRFPISSRSLSRKSAPSSTWLAPTSTWVTPTARATSSTKCCRKARPRRSRKRSAC